MYRINNQDGRAQTTLDFAIAMGVFLLAVAFVFTFIPSLTSPFIDGNQDQSAIADRVANNLAEGALVDAERPYVVNESCATVFFDDTTDESDIPAGCGYSGDNVWERVGVADRTNVNVTVFWIDSSKTGDDRQRQVCVYEDGTKETRRDGYPSGFTCAREMSDVNAVYAVGETPDEAKSTTVSRRVLTIPGCNFDADSESCDVTLRVTVW